jgi:DNA helicase-2/ATP-dependent DNA helicase PcrA
MVEFQDLTTPQKKAVEHTDRDLLVFAGAGTGKTTVLENRYDYLINQGVPQDEILLTSFNNTAVNEIKERISSVDTFDGSDVTTLHGLSLNIVSENSATSLDVYDTDAKEKSKQIKSLMKDVLVEGNRQASNHSDLQIDEELIETNAKLIENNLDLIRRRELHPLSEADEVIESDEFEIEKELKGEEQQTLRNFETVLKKTIEKFRKTMEEENRIDFVGMEFRAYKMLEEREQLRSKYQNRWSYIMIDEAQDLSTIQWKIIKYISEGQADLALIGDDSQAIYGWRGSDHTIMHKFQERDGVTTVTLDKSFRSTSQIINAVNDVSRNLDGGIREKILDSNSGETKDSEGHPKISSFDTLTFDESKHIAFQIEQLLSQGYEPDDIAVISRVSRPVTTTVAKKIRDRGLPCVNEASYSFLGRLETKYVLSILKAYSRPENDRAVSEAAEKHVKGLGENNLSMINREKPQDTLYESLATLKADDVKGVGSATAGKANDFIKFLESLKHSEDPFEDITSERGNWKKSISDQIDNWDSGRADRVEQLRNIVYDCIEEFSPEEVDKAVEKVELFGEDDGEGKVTVTTIHKAKGREWKVVFLPCMVQGYCPSGKSDDQDEEQRNFYVAISRAKEKCFLSYSDEVNGRDNQHPSEFLDFIYQDLHEALRFRSWGR